jgi:hypothetical protein
MLPELHNKSLVLNLLCSPGWLQIHDHGHLSARTIAVSHHARQENSCYFIEKQNKPYIPSFLSSSI